jgi:hypothetical protein
VDDTGADRVESDPSPHDPVAYTAHRRHHQEYPSTMAAWDHRMSYGSTAQLNDQADGFCE